MVVGSWQKEKKPNNKNQITKAKNKNLKTNGKSQITKSKIQMPNSNSNNYQNQKLKTKTS
jgi:hypothetical protein